MGAPKTIEHQIGGIQNDALRFELHGVKSDLVGAHPLESALESEFCKLYGTTLEPLPNIYLQAGLSALKTPYPLPVVYHSIWSSLPKLLWL